MTKMLSRWAQSKKSILSAQRLAFSIIHHSRLTIPVLRLLRKKYLPSFSSMNWREDIFPYFSHALNLEIYDDYRSIPPYPLQRSRVPFVIYDLITDELVESRKNLGSLDDLENEAAVQMYYPRSWCQCLTDDSSTYPNTSSKAELATWGGANTRLASMEDWCSCSLSIDLLSKVTNFPSMYML